MPFKINVNLIVCQRIKYLIISNIPECLKRFEQDEQISPNDLIYLSVIKYARIKTVPQMTTHYIH